MLSGEPRQINLPELEILSAERRSPSEKHAGKLQPNSSERYLGSNSARSHMSSAKKKLLKDGPNMHSRSLSHISNEDLRDQAAVKDGYNIESKRMSVPEAQSSRNMKMMAQTQPNFAQGVSSEFHIENLNNGKESESK